MSAMSGRYREPRRHAARCELFSARENTRLRDGRVEHAAPHYPLRQVLLGLSAVVASARSRGSLAVPDCRAASARANVGSAHSASLDHAIILPVRRSSPGPFRFVQPSQFLVVIGDIAVRLWFFGLCSSHAVPRLMRSCCDPYPRRKPPLICLRLPRLEPIARSLSSTSSIC